MKDSKSLPDPDVLEIIKDELISGQPDLPHVMSRIENNLQLTHEEASVLVYGLVLRLNSTLFPPITQMELILTQGCNLSCSYCFEKDMLGYLRMPERIALKAIDLLFSYSGKSERLNITLFGGEPLLNMETLRPVVRFAERKAAENGKTVFFNMTSNGTLINENTAEYLAEHGIKTLVSIDGLESTHDRFRRARSGEGTFEKAMKGLQRLKGKQPLGVKMTVMPEAARDLFENVKGLIDLGITHFVIGHASGMSWSENELNEFIEQWTSLYRWYRDGGKERATIVEFEEGESEGPLFGCQAGRNSISINVDGAVSPCSKMLGIDGKNIIGKLGDTEYGLVNIRNRINITRCLELMKECAKKGIDKDYQGGCFATNFEENKNIFSPSLFDYRLSKMKKTAIGCSTCR